MHKAESSYIQYKLQLYQLIKLQKISLHFLWYYINQLSVMNI